MKSPITQPLVDKLLKSKTRCEVWDTKLHSFYIQIRESGSGTYYVRYTPPNSEEKRTLRLGDAAILAVSQARALAQTQLARAAIGLDPAEERKLRKACPTLQAVIEDYYLPHAKKSKRSWHIDDGVFRCHILPALGGKPLSSITTANIQTLIQAMHDGGRTDVPKGRGRSRPSKMAQGYAPDSCNRVVSLMHHLYNLAIEEWKIPGVRSNPASNVRKFEVHNIRQTFLSPQQIGNLLKAGELKKSKRNELTLKIVMFLVLTGVRKSNALNARWCEIDQERGLWTIPRTKSGKPQILQLSTEVLTLLDHLGSQGESEYLFPNPKTQRPYISIFYSWNTMRKAAGLPDLRMHDLRHTFASMLINGGASLYTVQAALGHANPNMTMRYAHLSDQTQRHAIQSATSSISKFLPATTPSLGQSQRDQVLQNL